MGGMGQIGTDKKGGVCHGKWNACMWVGKLAVALEQHTREAQPNPGAGKPPMLKSLEAK